MPIDIEAIIGTAGIGYEVREYTGNNVEAAKATATGAWIQAVTGKPPQVLQLPSNRAKVVLTQTQIREMQKWLDSMVLSSLSPVKQQSIVEYELGPVFKPWAMKYALPSAALIFLAGFGIHWLASNI